MMIDWKATEYKCIIENSKFKYVRFKQKKKKKKKKENSNTEWHILPWDLSQRQTVNQVFMIDYKSWNIQNINLKVKRYFLAYINKEALCMMVVHFGTMWNVRG